jgi:hypothetical protein
MKRELADYFRQKAQAEDRSTASAIRVALVDYVQRHGQRQREVAA